MEDISVNPMVRFHKRMKQKKKERRKEANARFRSYGRKKQDQDEPAGESESEPHHPHAAASSDLKESREVEDKLPTPRELPQELFDPAVKIKVPGYKDEFSKAQIEYNRAFMDPKTRVLLPTKAATSKQVVLDPLEYHPKPNEKIYKNSDGVIITDDVLKLFGGKVDPSKIKIGVRSNRPNQQAAADPFNRVTETMNYDYLKEQEELKNPKPVAPPPPEPEVSKRLFIYDEEEGKVKALPQPNKSDNPDVIVKESTVKKKVRIENKPLLPPQLIRQHKPKELQQSQLNRGTPSSTAVTGTINNQDQFRNLLHQQKKPEDILNDFFQDIQKLK